MQLDTPGTTVKGPAATFTGDVYVTPMHGAQAPSRLTAALVRFTPGARSFWHHHGLGQLLICTEGFGFVATRDGTVVRLRAGESVWTPPGEDHWHGATGGTVMCHYTALEVPDDGSEVTTWLEPVTDEQYQAAHELG
jgi:quercetin dioxygenase-like cupin family protein